MNCRDISKMIAEGRVDRLEVVAHISVCARCRQDAEFQQRLGGILRQEIPLDPSLLMEARETAIRSSRTKTKGASFMRKTIWTTVGACALAAVFAVMAPRAEAASPKAKFASMKKAVLAKQDQTSISLQLSVGSDGKPKSVAFINGQMVDIQPGVPFEYHDGNKKIVINTNASSSGNLDSLPPEMRAQMEKAMKEAMAGRSGNGSYSEQYWINGKKVTREEAQKMMKDKGVGFNMGLDGFKFDFNFTLDENAYSSMTFGNNENTLLLTPKKGKNTRYAVLLDPRTNLPSSVKLQASKGGKWTDVNNSKFQYKPKRKT